MGVGNALHQGHVETWQLQTRNPFHLTDLRPRVLHCSCCSACLTSCWRKDIRQDPALALWQRSRSLTANNFWNHIDNQTVAVHCATLEVANCSTQQVCWMRDSPEISLRHDEGHGQQSLGPQTFPGWDAPLLREIECASVTAPFEIPFH